MNNKFTDDSTIYLNDVYDLAVKMKNTETNEFHFISKMWYKLEYPLLESELITISEYNALAMYWFDHLEKGVNEDTNISLTEVTNKILQESANIANILESKKVDIIHIFFGILKVDSKVSVMLREYGFTPIKVLQLNGFIKYD